MPVPGLDVKALAEPVDWQEISEGATLLLGDLESIAIKHNRLDVMRVIQIIEYLAQNPAMAQLVANGVNLLRQRWTK